MWWVCSFFLFPSCIISSSLIVQPAAQDKPPVVAEWGSGVTPRHDPDTISKHVNQMVDVSLLCLRTTLLFTSSLHIHLKQNQAEWSKCVFSFPPMLCCPLQSIMKNYDQNQDGYISLQDFEEIAANFPFSFCIRKTDR